MEIIEKFVNALTGEENILKRDATADEIDAMKKAKAETLRLQKEAKSKEEAKAALLDRLGITAEEAALLLG